MVKTSEPHSEMVCPDGSKSTTDSEISISLVQRFLNRVAGRKTAETSANHAPEPDGVLPCIGRKSGLVPVSAEIGRLVAPRPGILSIYEKIASQVRETLPYDRLTITVLDQAQNTFRNAFVSGRAIDGLEQGNRYPLQDSFASEVADSRRAIHFNPSGDYPEKAAFARTGLLSRIATPLISDDKVVGTLHLTAARSNAYGEQDLLDLEKIGNQVAEAVNNSTLVQAEQDRTNQLEALYRVAAILAQPQSFEAKAQQILETLIRIADADQAMVRRADEDGECLNLVATAGSGTISFDPSLSICDQSSASCGAFRDGRVLLMNDYQTSPDAIANMKSQGVASLLVIPVKSRGRSVGTLNVVSKTTNHFNNERVALLTAFADEIGTIFDTAELIDDLKESSARAQAVMDTAKDGIITINEKGIIETFNAAAEVIFGYGHGEVIGRNVNILMPEPTQGAHDGYISQYLATGQAKIIGAGREMEGQRKDGTVFPMDLSLGVVQIGGSKVFTGIVRDITDRKRTEADLNESRRLASVGELAVGVAHEINNPLAAIILASDLLRNGELSDQASHDVITIYDSARRAASIVQNMLLFARKTNPEPERMSIDVITQEMLELKSHDFRMNAVEAQLDVEPGLPDCLIDKQQIGQVIINVLNNAEHALVSHSGGGNINICIRFTTGSVVLEVRDDGPGIDPEHLPKIFEPFFTTKSAGEGTGLGLSICYGIIQQHGGEMWAVNRSADSADGSAGTSVFIQLPVAGAAISEGEAPGQPAAHRAGPAVPTAAGVKKARILVVDDEPAILDIIARGLRGEIDQIDKAGSGDIALKMVQGSDYDCIFLDLRMPGMNGIEVFNRVAASDARSADRIVFMTGDTASQETAAFLSNKKNLTISKPFRLEDLIRVISSLRSSAARG